MTDRKTYIVGAGISGLIAAWELEKAGFSPVILEESDRVGGRVRTDYQDGYALDHGFQVLLTAYPEAKAYLDYEALDLKTFQPGAVILKPGDTFSIYDPLRNPFRLPAMVFSQVGNLLDKLRIFQLTKELREKHVEEIFQSPEMTTQDYLKKRGFSDRMMKNFFIPFFRGIFLEEKLETSSRMFEFVFKMFGEGHAAVPAKGMGEIPKFLASRLVNTSIRLNTKVNRIDHNVIHLASGDTITADDILLTLRPGNFLEGYDQPDPGYRTVTTLYYSLQQSFIAKPSIGLVPDDHFLINNIVFMTDVSKSYSTNGRALLSVSIVKEVAHMEQLEQFVSLELEALSGIAASHFQHIKTFRITKALPILEGLRYTRPLVHYQLHDHLFVTGDHMLYGSVNAAMQAGRSAAQAILSKKR
ncbi:MAG: FAD-dependent oxidoreductase [Lunatimonas sp.]|uniref:NAD(P)/FAD-dependent oxidoreductase n=1 Tax=Lunatimonas sp. TaxID=2060141 RepID=UPI00263BE1AA|nr:NAD(P)/FAD-dependent oxidoreductase [Lunatimonas sp.]MCC5939320.1 FAD-dependent oxidoreductase [Lunatimonas sp.]